MTENCSTRCLPASTAGANLRPMPEDRRDFGRAFQRPGRRGWYVRYRFGGTERVFYAGPKKSHATRTLDRVHDELCLARARGRALPAVSKGTLASFSKQYLALSAPRMSACGLSLATQHLTLAADRLRGPLSAISPAAIEDFARWLSSARSLAPATVNRYLTTLSGLFKAARRRGLVSENPCSSVPRLQVTETAPPYLSEADRRSLEAHASRRWRPLLRLASATGLRLGELTRLQWRDLDLSTGRVTVRPPRDTPSTKTRRVRHVPLEGRDLEDARSMDRPSPSRPQDRVFPRLRTRRRWLQRHFRAWAQSADLGPLRFHDLRHGWASRLAESGADDAVLMLLGGWSSPAMVRRYAHHRPENAAREAVRRMASKNEASTPPHRHESPAPATTRNFPVDEPHDNP